MRITSFVRFVFVLLGAVVLAACGGRERYDAGTPLAVELDDAGFGRWGTVYLNRVLQEDGGVGSLISASFFHRQVLSWPDSDAGCTAMERGDCSLWQCPALLPHGVVGGMPQSERASAGVVHVRTELDAGVDLIPDAGDAGGLPSSSLYRAVRLDVLQGSTVFVRADGDEVPPFVLVLPNLKDMQVLEVSSVAPRDRDFVVRFRPTPSAVNLTLGDSTRGSEITCLTPGEEGLVRVPAELMAALPSGKARLELNQSVRADRRVGAWVVSAVSQTKTRWPDGGLWPEPVTVE